MTKATKQKFCAVCQSQKAALMRMNKRLFRCVNTSACKQRLMKDPDLRIVAAVVLQLAGA